MATTALMTADQFAQMITSEAGDYELVEGELVPLSSATPLHGKVRGRMERWLGNYFERNSIGEVLSETDCRITDETVRRPDVSIFLGERLQQIDPNTIPIPFGPDIAVEILSPSESAIDVHRKVRAYLSSGSQEVWILDYVNGELFIHTHGGIRLLVGEDALESPLLPGFTASVRELLAGF